MRKIVLDTETTGLDPAQGDRIIEIAAIELINDIPTENTFQTLINPLCPISPGAKNIHGITDDMVAHAPLFEHIVDDLLTFLSDSPLIIHNATFDLKFLNYELSLLHKDPITPTRVIDTVALARAKFPGSPVNLDALCRRFQIPLTGREKHSALLDCQLLARVYLELIGGRQQNFLETLRTAPSPTNVTLPQTNLVASHLSPGVRIIPSAEEIAQHEAFLNKINNPIWRRTHPPSLGSTK